MTETKIFAADSDSEIQNRAVGSIEYVGSDGFIVTATHAGDPAFFGGKRLFPTDGDRRPLELVSSATTSTGVLMCVYRPGETPPLPALRDGRGCNRQTRAALASATRDLTAKGCPVPDGTKQ